MHLAALQIGDRDRLTDQFLDLGLAVAVQISADEQVDIIAGRGERLGMQHQRARRDLDQTAAHTGSSVKRVSRCWILLQNIVEL